MRANQLRKDIGFPRRRAPSATSAIVTYSAAPRIGRLVAEERLERQLTFEVDMRRPIAWDVRRHTFPTTMK